MSGERVIDVNLIKVAGVTEETLAEMVKHIDRGSAVDLELKLLVAEDKGIKTKIVELAEEVLNKGETAIKLSGETGVALISKAESMKVNAGAAEFPALSKAIDEGFLTDTVDRKRELLVPSDSVDSAVKALKDAGITATVVERFTVKAANVRKMRASEASSVQVTNAQKALEECLTSDCTFRVKYDHSDD